MTNIKIITINTWKCDGDYRKRMESLSTGLRLLKPDFVACQECFVCEETKTNTLQFLAEKLGMNYLFANGREKKRYFESKWVNSFSGLGILSAYPAKAYNVFSLPSNAEDNDRKAQQAVVSLPGGKELLLTNLHLTHLRDIDLRKAQAEFVAQRVASVSVDYIKMVCGDFNAELSSEEIGAFMTSGNAVDAYTAGGGIAPRCSLVEAYQAGQNICVDHIFAFPNADRKYPQFINAEVILNSPGSNGIFPSDHFGISTTLIIN